jgi:hypothetical protein
MFPMHARAYPTRKPAAEPSTPPTESTATTDKPASDKVAPDKLAPDSIPLGEGCDSRPCQKLTPTDTHVSRRGPGDDLATSPSPANNRASV